MRCLGQLTSTSCEPVLIFYLTQKHMLVLSPCADNYLNASFLIYCNLCLCFHLFKDLHDLLDELFRKMGEWMRSNLLGKKYKCPIKKSKYKPNRGELAKKNSLLLCEN